MEDKIDSKLLKEIDFRKEKLPAVSIKNTVVWVNPHLAVPFALKVGAPTNLGYFLTPAVEGKSARLSVQKEHGRSGSLPPVIYSDDKGVCYGETDIKGIGRLSYANPQKTSLTVGLVRERNDSSPVGLAELDSLIYDAEINEELYQLGIRCCRTVAVAKIHEIVDEKGKIISVKEAKKKGLIKVKREPAIAIRAYRTKTRISDLPMKDKQPEENPSLTLAKRLIAKELGKEPPTMSDKEYLTWFASTLGKQIGLMHRHGYVHNYLIRHNITLDCCLVDFDSVEKLSSPNERMFQRDFGEAEIALDFLVLKVDPNQGRFYSLYLKAYQETMNQA